MSLNSRDTRCTRCHAGVLAKRLREVGLTCKADGQRDLGDRKPRRRQHSRRRFQAAVPHIAMWWHAEACLEAMSEVPSAHSRDLSQIGKAEVFAQMGIDVLDHAPPRAGGKVS